MGLGRKICMIMRRSIWSDNDQSSRERLKAIEITMLEEHIVISFSEASKTYLYQVLVELCHRGLQTSTVFKTWLISLPCLRF